MVDVQIGYLLTLGECRPLDKTVCFNVLKVIRSSSRSSEACRTVRSQLM
ncbi:rCG63624 [Rattus norvegicus]|uniref:RCG63624 n=1 Tax=Rattus norvegicus TaxID=10116 RepID=A6JFJ7_RAT|nr:rCG63624 [Rattus norvegicus]